MKIFVYQRSGRDLLAKPRTRTLGSTEMEAELRRPSDPAVPRGNFHLTRICLMYCSLNLPRWSTPSARVALMGKSRRYRVFCFRKTCPKHVRLFKRTCLMYCSAVTEHYGLPKICTWRVYTPMRARSISSLQKCPLNMRTDGGPTNRLASR